MNPEYIALEEVQELPWYKNRKLVSPMIAGLASLLIAILKAAFPDLPLTEELLVQLLSWIWTAGLGIPLADALYDQAVLLNMRRENAPKG